MSETKTHSRAGVIILMGMGAWSGGSWILYAFGKYEWGSAIIGIIAMIAMMIMIIGVEVLNE